MCTENWGSNLHATGEPHKNAIPPFLTHAIICPRKLTIFTFLLMYCLNRELQKNAYCAFQFLSAPSYLLRIFLCHIGIMHTFCIDKFLYLWDMARLLSGMSYFFRFLNESTLTNEWHWSVIRMNAKITLV